MCASTINSSTASEMVGSASKKHVRWSTVTVYEFGVAIGGSAIPRHGGPSVGLSKKPKHVWCTAIDGNDDEHWLQRSSSIDCSREANTASEHCPDDDDEERAVKSRARAVTMIEERRQRRRNRVRWLKPFERVAMLTNAGLSEKRICRMMKECAAISMSRRINLRACFP